MTTLAFLEGPDLIIVVLVVVLIFGSSRLPKLARSLGEAQRELHKAMREQDGPEPSTSPGDLAPGATAAVADAPATVTLSQAELDAMLEARENQVRRQLAEGKPSDQTG
jgi:sec-independent protein translocase protein TatA